MECTGRSEAKTVHDPTNQTWPQSKRWKDQNQDYLHWHPNKKKNITWKSLHRLTIWKLQLSSFNFSSFIFGDAQVFLTWKGEVPKYRKRKLLPKKWRDIWMKIWKLNWNVSKITDVFLNQNRVKTSVIVETFQLIFCVFIKNMLKRRKESDTYLTTDSRHRQSPQIAMKVNKVFSFQPALQPSSTEWWRPQCRLKPTHFIHFHRDLQTPAMSTVSSRVGVALFPSF